MLSTTVIKNPHIRPFISSSIRLLHLIGRRHNSNINRHQLSGIQKNIRSNVSTSNKFYKTAKQRTTILSNKFNKSDQIISPKLKCRLIQPNEFTNEFEHFVFRTFFLNEPMSKYLGATEPDECIMLFLRQVLQRAKEDGVSLGIYDDTDNHTSETNDKYLVKQGGTQQSSHSSSINRQKLPVCYIINHIESVDDPPNKNDLAFDLSKASIENRNKYKYIGDILSEIVYNIDLFTEYKAHRIMQNFLSGNDPHYANQELFTRLKIATIELARKKDCDLIYSKTTSQISTRANLKLGFHKARIIDYNMYADDNGQRVFNGMSTIHRACTLTVKDLRD